MTRMGFHQGTGWIALALGLVLAGCETGAQAILGGSMAKGRLYALARDKVLALDAAAAPSCPERSIVSTRVIDRPSAAATDYDHMYSVGLPDVSRGVQTPSAQPSSASTVPVAFTERWVVERCGERAAYRVRFSPGDIVEVSPEPQPRSSTKP
jgi:hypothetical protein